MTILQVLFLPAKKIDRNENHEMREERRSISETEDLLTFDENRGGYVRRVKESILMKRRA